MYTLCATEKTASQQKQFEQTFLRMILESHYDTITISELCRQAGLSRKIFYRLFEKKSDVLYALVDHTLLEAQNYIPDESVGPGDLHRFFAFWRTQKDLLDALHKHQNSGMLIDRAIHHVLKERSELTHTFGADSGNFGFEIMAFYISGIFTLIQTWHARNYDRSIDEMSQLLLNLLSTTPIKTPIERTDILP